MTNARKERAIVWLTAYTTCPDRVRVQPKDRQQSSHATQRAVAPDAAADALGDDGRRLQAVAALVNRGHDALPHLLLLLQPAAATAWQLPRSLMLGWRLLLLLLLLLLLGGRRGRRGPPGKEPGAIDAVLQQPACRHIHHRRCAYAHTRVRPLSRATPSVHSAHPGLFPADQPVLVKN